jgi:acyl-coenzyme A synthetase/AMP-(fatty) acid ligase
VIPVPDVAAGEVPKAFIVLAPHHRGQLFQSPAELAEELETYIQHEKANFKWLRGGIEFVDVIPKSPSGKILRRILREAERLKRRQRKGKL